MAVKAHYKLISENPEKIDSALTQAALAGGKPILMTTQISQGNVITVFIVVEYLPQ